MSPILFTYPCFKINILILFHLFNFKIFFFRSQTIPVKYVKLFKEKPSVKKSQMPQWWESLACSKALKYVSMMPSPYTLDTYEFINVYKGNMC